VLFRLHYYDSYARASMRALTLLEAFCSSLSSLLGNSSRIAHRTELRKEWRVGV
jgi:hypothetical protein